MGSLSAKQRELVHRRLDVLLETRDHARHMTTDPVSFVHAYSRADDKEIVGLLASSLAFGNVKAVRASVARVLAILGEHPARYLARTDEASLRTSLKGFVHRVYKGNDVARLLTNASSLQLEHGSLGAFVASLYARHHSQLRETLAEFATALRGPKASRGLQHLMPDPMAGSACKRLLLYCRWMIRPADGVDVGLWPMPPSALVIPVDTHIHRIAQNLRLTTRQGATWATAEEITSQLRRFDADDPVKYDFALCHLGVSRDCPSRRDAAKCEPCTLREVCRHWQSQTLAKRRATG